MAILTLPHQQRGVALFMALIMLVIITLLSISTMRSSIMELRIAGNYQQQATAVESAQSAIDASFDLDNFPVIGEGYTICYNVTGCDQTITTMPDTASYKAATNQLTITQTNEGTVSCRACESSSALFDGASFTISSTYNNTANNGGRAEINAGYVMLVPKMGH